MKTNSLEVGFSLEAWAHTGADRRIVVQPWHSNGLLAVYLSRSCRRYTQPTNSTGIFLKYGCFQKWCLSFLYPVHPGDHLVIRYLEPKIATEHFLVDELLIYLESRMTPFFWLIQKKCIFCNWTFFHYLHLFLSFLAFSIWSNLKVTLDHRCAKQRWSRDCEEAFVSNFNAII